MSKRVRELFLWALKGWVLPVLALIILIIPTYMLGYFWLAVTFAGFAITLGVIELLAMYKTGETISVNTAKKIKRRPTTVRLVALAYLIFTILIAIHFYTIAFH